MIETLLGGLLGGIFRCIPEILKFFDAKNERGHELAMQDKALAFQQLTGQQRIDELSTAGQQTYNTGALDTLKAALESQKLEFKPTGYAWVDMLMAITVFITTSVRPAVTYILVGLYVTAKIALVYQVAQHTIDLSLMVKVLWTADDQGILSAILNFWFLGRVFDKVR